MFRSRQPPNTNPKIDPNKDIDAGEHARRMTSRYDGDKFIPAHHDFYSDWDNDELTRNKKIKEWIKKVPVEIITIHQAALMAETGLLDKDTFDKLYKLHIKPFTNNMQSKNKENWLYVGDYFKNFASSLDSLKNLAKKYGYPPFDFIKKQT